MDRPLLSEDFHTPAGSRQDLGPASCTIRVPDAAKPGDLLQVKAPDGTRFKAVVPRRKKPGDTFDAEYKKEAGSHKPEAARYWWWLWLATILAAVAILALVYAYVPSARRRTLDIVLWIAQEIHLHLLLVFFVLPFFLTDWVEHGLRVTLQESVSAAVITAIVATILGMDMPLASVLLLGGSIAFLLYVSLAFLVFPFLGQFFVGPQAMWAMVVLLVLILLQTVFGINIVQVMDGVLSGDVGKCLIYLICYSMLRSDPPHHPDLWRNVESVSAKSEEFHEQETIFMEECATLSHKYNFKLKVIQLWRVDRPPHRAASRVFPRTPARLLYHGTSWKEAQHIVSDGFRLPNTSGKFGYGVHFADCPLGCWRYCSPGLFRNTGLILGTWVELGRVQDQKEEANDLGYGWDSWIQRLRGHRLAYDSVRGLMAEDGGVLEATEYVIYNRDQGRVAYIFEVEKVE